MNHIWRKGSDATDLSSETASDDPITPETSGEMRQAVPAEADAEAAVRRAARLERWTSRRGSMQLIAQFREIPTDASDSTRSTEL